MNQEHDTTNRLSPGFPVGDSGVDSTIKNNISGEMQETPTELLNDIIRKNNDDPNFYSDSRRVGHNDPAIGFHSPVEGHLSPVRGASVTTPEARFEGDYDAIKENINIAQLQTVKGGQNSTQMTASRSVSVAAVSAAAAQVLAQVQGNEDSSDAIEGDGSSEDEDASDEDSQDQTTAPTQGPEDPHNTNFHRTPANRTHKSSFDIKNIHSVDDERLDVDMTPVDGSISPICPFDISGGMSPQTQKNLHACLQSPAAENDELPLGADEMNGIDNGQPSMSDVFDVEEDLQIDGYQSTTINRGATEAKKEVGNRSEGKKAAPRLGGKQMRVSKKKSKRMATGQTSDKENNLSAQSSTARKLPTRKNKFPTNGRWEKLPVGAELASAEVKPTAANPKPSFGTQIIETTTTTIEKTADLNDTEHNKKKMPKGNRRKQITATSKLATRRDTKQVTGKKNRKINSRKKPAPCVQHTIEDEATDEESNAIRSTSGNTSVDESRTETTAITIPSNLQLDTFDGSKMSQSENPCRTEDLGMKGLAQKKGAATPGSLLSQIGCFASPADSEAEGNKAILEAANKLLQSDPEGAAGIPNSNINRCPEQTHEEGPLSETRTEARTHNRQDSDNLRRTVNPLVGFPMETPPWPVDSNNGDPPHISEILQWSQIYHPNPDTFPISYYARLLGIDVQEFSEASEISSDALEHLTFSVPQDNVTHAIPPLGRAMSVGKEQESLSSKGSETHDDYKGTLYETFLRDGWDESWLTPFNPGNVLNSMKECIQKATKSELVDMSNWLLEPRSEHIDDAVQIWSFEAHNNLSRVSDYKLSYRFHHYCQMHEDESLPLDMACSPTVVSLHNLDCFANDILPSEESDKSTILLILFGLVVEVGRSCGALYFLLDVTDLKEPVVEVLRAHFGMTWVQNDGNDNPRERLICDLVSCSLRYALLVRRASGRGGTPAVGPSGKERLLVALPTIEATTDKRHPDRHGTMRERNMGGCEDQRMTSAAGWTRHAHVGLRVKKASRITPQVAGDMVFINKRGQEKGVCFPQKYVSSIPDWQVLKAFHLGNQSFDNDEILECLKQKQEALESLETNALGSKVKDLMERVIEERVDYQGAEKALKRSATQKTLEEYEKRFSSKDIGRTWQQLEDDMEAVCGVCNDGEVTPHNWIVICDGCETPLHQSCYGINEVPKGKFFCGPCQLKRDGVMLEDPVCELCPISYGAFHQITTIASNQRKWVHVICAEWQGLAKAGPGRYEDPKDIMDSQLLQGLACCLCSSARGTFSRCQQENCKKYMHVTCALDCGMCDVKHGETGIEATENHVFCPEHSTQAEGYTVLPVPDLVCLTARFPSVVPTPMLKPFATRAQQRAFLLDPEHERELLYRLRDSLNGARCDVCSGDYGTHLEQCQSCKARICVICTESSESERCLKRGYRCGGCHYAAASAAPSKQEQVRSTPQCSLCYQKGGWIRKATATPTPKQKARFKNNPADFAKSYFSKELWCHTICSRTHIDVRKQDDADGRVELSDVILARGQTFVRPKASCSLCGHTGGLKKSCNHKRCRSSFHATCAWQAGFSVAAPKIGDKTFNVNCLFHSNTENNLRAKVEDLLDIEETRAKKQSSADAPLTNNEAAEVLNVSIDIMRILGWAWRWEEWWVKKNFNWEPYLPHMETWQTEADFTDEEKKIVVSTPESRLADAEYCSLASFGAALRNRNYDICNGFDNRSLRCALRAILETKSLVGPLKDVEIEFLVEWLGRAYRSKSGHLCFGDEKIEIGKLGTANKFCYDRRSSPKFELGDRPLPGKEASKSSDFDESHGVGGDGHMVCSGNSDVLGQAVAGQSTAVAANSSDNSEVSRSSRGLAAKDKSEGKHVPVAQEASVHRNAGGERCNEMGCLALGEEARLREVAADESVPNNVEKATPAGCKTSAIVNVATAPKGHRSPAKNGDMDSETAGVSFWSQGYTEKAAKALSAPTATLGKGTPTGPRCQKKARVDYSGRSPQKEDYQENTVNEGAKTDIKQSGGGGYTVLSTGKRSREDAALNGIPSLEVQQPATKATKTVDQKAIRDVSTAETVPIVKAPSAFASSSLAVVVDSQTAVKAVEVGEDNLKFKKRSVDEGEEEQNSKDGKDEQIPASEESEACDEGEDDDESEESIKSVHTVRTRKSARDAVYQEAYERHQCTKRQTKKPKATNRLGNATAETAKLTASPACKSFSSNAGKTYKSGMSRRPKPTRPSKGVSFGQLTTIRPAKVGIKGSSVNEDEIEDEIGDDGSCLDEATFSGRSLTCPRDEEVSVLTMVTAFPKSEVEDDVKSKDSFGSDAKTLDAAIKQAESDDFVVCRNAFPHAKIDTVHCNHVKAVANRSSCALCSSRETIFGCNECFIQAFEHKYNVKIDRNKRFPRFLQHRTVPLCCDPNGNEEGLSCYERWHTQDFEEGYCS